MGESVVAHLNLRNDSLAFGKVEVKDRESCRISCKDQIFSLSLTCYQQFRLKRCSKAMGES